jgi:hypothetical protein
MYLRLVRDASTLTGELRSTVDIILNGTRSMDPSHLDVTGLADTGVRWWRVASDATKRLYFECFKLCTLSREYRDLAPTDVQEMVAVLEISDRTLQECAAKVSLTKAIAEDQARRRGTSLPTEQYIDFKPSTSPPTAAEEMATFLVRHRQALPIDLAQLYASTESLFSSHSTTPPSSQSHPARGAAHKHRKINSNDGVQPARDDEVGAPSSDEHTESDNDGRTNPTRRPKRSRVSMSEGDTESDYDEHVRPAKRSRVSVSEEDVESEDNEPVRPAKRTKRPLVLVTEDDEDSDYDEPFRPAKRLKGPQVSVSEDNDESDDDGPIDPTKRARYARASAATNGSRSNGKLNAQKSNRKRSSKPGKKGGLPPGKKFYQWSTGRLRAYRAILKGDDKDLPTSAINGPTHELESSCTSPATDMRLCDFGLSIEEVLTVSS